MPEIPHHPDLEQASDDELFALLRRNRSEADAESTKREQACKHLYRRYHAKVQRWCLRFVRDEQTAEDLTQGVFLELLEKPAAYRDHGRFGSWLYVLTRSRCLNQLRSMRRRGEADGDMELADLLEAPDDPHRDSELGELRARIDGVCRRHLDAREQEVVHLRYGLGLKVAEITEVLGLTNASGARTHLRSAEHKLRRYLERIRRELGGE